MRSRLSVLSAHVPTRVVSPHARYRRRRDLRGVAWSCLRFRALRFLPSPLDVVNSCFDVSSVFLTGLPLLFVLSSVDKLLRKVS